MRKCASWIMALAVLVPGSMAGQELADRITSTDGDVRLSYRTKNGVCGDGQGMINTAGRHWKGHQDSRCQPGPARMTLTVRNGEIRDADIKVGGVWEGTATRNLGTVSAPDAAEAFLALARRPDTRGDELILGAVLADSAVVWPGLLALARATTVNEDIRDDAVLWLGFAAGEALGPDETGHGGDFRESAVFALSQRPMREAVPALVRVIEGDHPVHLRKTALFWLGQTDRARAIAIYEDILRDG
jgi:hypothetical protein